nr:hypothetical protein [Mycobacterium tuberculosis]
MAKGFDRNFVLMASSRVRAGAGQVARTHVDVGMSKDLRGRRFSRIVVVVLLLWVVQPFSASRLSGSQARVRSVMSVRPVLVQAVTWWAWLW